MVSFGLTGIMVNLAGFAIYSLLTWQWLDPKSAVTVLYPLGTLLGYYGHSRFSFSYEGLHLPAFPRYILAHAVGYGINIAMLKIFVDQMGCAHHVIQGMAIIVVAGTLFPLNRYYVFLGKH
jgi:putative flippase GtrA